MTVAIKRRDDNEANSATDKPTPLEVLDAQEHTESKVAAFLASVLTASENVGERPAAALEIEPNVKTGSSVRPATEILVENGTAVAGTTIVVAATRRFTLGSTFCR